MSKYVLGDIFIGDYPVTQLYGANPQYYQQFGFNAHEGVDWGTPIGIPIVAPFDGKIVQDQDDLKSGAYGDYIVVWDPVQQCAIWLCHLSNNQVDFGQYVKKGQVLGLTGNSGNSTGPHLHVNFVETDINGSRLDRDNGYKGMKNILDPQLVDWQLGSGGTIPSPIQPEVITIKKEIDRIYTNLGFPPIATSQQEDIESIKGEIDRIYSNL